MAVNPLGIGGQLIGKLFGNAVSTAVGFAFGSAMSPALEPAVRDIANEINSRFAYVFPQPGELASGVAQGQIDAKTAGRWASYWGVGDAAFKALVDIANVGPGSGYAFDLWRRGEIDEAGFRRAVKRLGLEQEWIDDLVKIKEQILSVQELAVMVQRGIAPNETDPATGQPILPNQPSRDGSNVPPMPGIDVQTLKEAEGHGFNFQRFAGLARIIGLPASPDLAARMHFRGLITEGAYNQAILEGNTRGEWAPFLLEGFRQILTAHDWVELHLRGYIGRDEMLAGTALHGMSPEDSDRLYRVLGRPLPAHQITTALARGAQFHPIEGELKDPYEAAAHESNIKPSYYEMWIANKYSYPSLFQLNNLVKASAITPDQAADWATKNGLAPEVVAAMLKFWKAEQGAGTTPGARSATGRAVTAVSKAYIAARTSRTEAEAELTKLSVDPATFDGLFTAWDVNREATIAAMTNLQIRNAFRNFAMTETEALARLEARGLTAAEALAYLTAKPGTSPATG